jgi:hypothetical protein
MARRRGPTYPQRQRLDMLKRAYEVLINNFLEQMLDERNLSRRGRWELNKMLVAMDHPLRLRNWL